MRVALDTKIKAPTPQKNGKGKIKDSNNLGNSIPENRIRYSIDFILFDMGPTDKCI